MRLVPDVVGAHKQKKASMRDPGQSLYRSIKDDIKETVAEIKQESPFKRIAGDKTILWNTIAMMMIWSFSNFNYFLITFQLKSLGDNAYISNYVSDGAEIMANLLSLSIITKFGFRKTMIFLYLLAGAAMIVLASLPPPVDEHANLLIVVYIFIILSKFGIAGCYNLSYVGNGILFDPSVLGTTIGLCTASSRAVNAGAKPVAEIEPEVIGKWIYVGLCLVGVGVMFAIIIPKKEDQTKEPEQNEYDKQKTMDRKEMMKSLKSARAS